MADWLRYGESRSDWADVLAQAVDATGLSEKTLKNVRAVGAIDPSRRRDGVEFALHAEVVGLEPGEQDYWLERTETEGWTRQELRLEIRAAKRTKVLEGQAALEGMFRVIYADPPWLYNDRGVVPENDAYGRAERHYPGMTMDELCKLLVAAHALPNAVLFLWVPALMLLEKPGPREVIEAWGFEPKTGMVWDKVLHNFGHYVSVRHEHLIIATRGSCLPAAPTPDSVQTIRREGEHSAKPEEFRQIIEKLYTKGPRLELFARKRIEGWTCFGNDARLWAAEAEASYDRDRTTVLAEGAEATW